MAEEDLKISELPPLTTTASADIVPIVKSADQQTYGITVQNLQKIATGTPASASATGEAGQVKYDSSYLYICTATNTWRRIAHSTW